MHRCTPTSYRLVNCYEHYTASAWGYRNLWGGRYYIGAVKIAERMVVIAINTEVLYCTIVNFRTSQPLHRATPLSTSPQSEAGSANT